MGADAFSLPALGPLGLTAARWVRALLTSVMPWDRLCTDHRLSDRSSPARDYLDRAHRRGVFYALAGEFNRRVRRLLPLGIGVLLASHAVQIMNFLFAWRRSG